MKKIFLLSALAIAALAVIVSCFLPSDNKPAEESEIKTTLYSEDREVLYIMKTYKNGIAVFKPSDKEPVYTLKEVHVKSLPEYDQKLLDSGIKIYSERELQSLIEDYDS